MRAIAQLIPGRIAGNNMRTKHMDLYEKEKSDGTFRGK